MTAFGDFDSLCDQIGIDEKNRKLMFLGAGNMAMALVEGCLKSGFAKPHHIALSCRTEATKNKWKALHGFDAYLNNREMIDQSPKDKFFSILFFNNIYVLGILIIAVKPQVFNDVFSNPASYASEFGLVISLITGVNWQQLSKTFNFPNSASVIPIIRLCPSTPCAIGAGASLIYAPPNIDAKKLNIARAIASSAGTYLEIPESVYNAAQAVSGCGPAWTYMFIESLADGGVLSGLTREQSMKLAAQTVMGAAKMVLESGEHPGALKDKVCSPAGTTIHGVRALEKQGFRYGVMEAVKAATDRAEELTKK